MQKQALAPEVVGSYARRLAAAGYDERAMLLAHMHAAGIPAGFLREWLWTVWRNQPDDAPRPPADQWIAMFGAAGYQLAGRPARRPRLARRLFRGATVENRLGLSWTTNPGVAHHFALSRQEPRSRGLVWTAVVSPRRFLAAGVDEAEFVIGADGLQVTEFDASSLPVRVEHPRLPRLPHRLRGR